MSIYEYHTLYIKDKNNNFIEFNPTEEQKDFFEPKVTIYVTNEESTPINLFKNKTLSEIMYDEGGEIDISIGMFKGSARLVITQDTINKHEAHDYIDKMKNNE